MQPTRATQGPIVTFDDFVHARLPHLLRFGRALTGDEHRGADLVQDALERALPRWDRIDSEDPEGYVRRIMVNRNISVWRRVRHERLTDIPLDRVSHDVERDEALFAAPLLVYGSGTSRKNIALPCSSGAPGLDDPTPPPVVHGTTVFAVCGRNIETTDLDGPATWTVLGKIHGTVRALLPLDDRRVLVKTRTVAVYDDHGSHPADLHPAPREQLMRISTESESAWVVGIDGSVFSSADGGSTWTRLE